MNTRNQEAKYVAFRALKELSSLKYFTVKMAHSTIKFYTRDERVARMAFNQMRRAWIKLGFEYVTERRGSLNEI